MNKKCPNCNELIVGRIDKVFCNSYCKSNYHYESNKGQEPTVFQKIDKQLKLNRRLLSSYNQSGKSTIRKEKLLEAGFNPKYFTHYWKNSSGKIYLFCYDIGFLELKENGRSKYILINYQESYMGRL